MTRILTAALFALVLQQAPTYWCPMHPDQRAASAILCPVCKMKMVPIPPFKVGEYRVDVAPLPAAKTAGLVGVRLTLREPEGAVVTALETVHEQPLHVFIISSDFGFFRHVHAERVEHGVADVLTPVPPGEYMLIADFVPSGGVPQLVHRALMSPGPRATPLPRGPLWVAGGVRARPAATMLEAGAPSTVEVTLTGADDGRPVVDLEPYLGAAAHLLLVNQKLTEAVHAHAAEGTGAEHALEFEITLPAPGEYQGWLQLQRAGSVITVPVSFTGR